MWKWGAIPSNAPLTSRQINFVYHFGGFALCMRDGVYNKQVLTWEIIYFSSFYLYYIQITAILLIFNEFQYDPFRCTFKAHSFPGRKNEIIIQEAKRNELSVEKRDKRSNKKKSAEIESKSHENVCMRIEKLQLHGRDCCHHHHRYSFGVHFQVIRNYIMLTTQIYMLFLFRASATHISHDFMVFSISV